VREDVGFAFSCTLVSSGTYTIDWGDGVIETARASTIVYTHTHTTGGTPCSLGYNTWKVRIYNATTDITRFIPSRHTLQSRRQNCPILSVVMATLNITSFANNFYNSSALLNFPYFKACVMPTTINSCTTTVSMFNMCT